MGAVPVGRAAARAMAGTRAHLASGGASRLGLRETLRRTFDGGAARDDGSSPLARRHQLMGFLSR